MTMTSEAADEFTWDYGPDGSIALISRSGHHLWFANWEQLRAFGWVMINAADHNRDAAVNDDTVRRDSHPARFDGGLCVCLEPIRRGQPITWDNIIGTWGHTECLT